MIRITNILVIAILLSGTMALGDAITVTNFGFEWPALVSGSNGQTYTPTAWNIFPQLKPPVPSTPPGDPAGGWTVTVEPMDVYTKAGRLWGGVSVANTTEGRQFGWFSTNAYVNTDTDYIISGLSQNVVSSIVPGMRYELSVDAMYQNNNTAFAWSGSIFKIQILVDGVVVAGDPCVPITSSWNAYQVVYDSTTADVGKTLAIKLYLNATNNQVGGVYKKCQVNFDNISLNAIDIGSHAYDPTPKNGATDPNIAALILKWNEATVGGPYTHKVYLGTDPEDLSLIATVTGTPNAEYTPADMKYETKYYWRVDEVAGETTHTGYPWSFTTARAVCSSELAGDLLRDCRVDFQDAVIMMSNWLDCTRPVPSDCP